MSLNFRTITQVLCKIQLIQFERVKIESHKNSNSHSKLCFSGITLIHLSCLTNSVIRTLHEIHVILFDVLPVPSTLFLFMCIFLVLQSRI